MATFFSTNSPSASNPSVGTTGVTAPTSATEIGGIGPTGNLVGVGVDAFGNLGIQAPSDRVVTGNLTALNSAVTVNSNGSGTVMIELSGVWVGTVTFEGSNDSFATSQAITAVCINTPLALASTTTVNGFYSVLPQGFQSTRVRMSAYTSGTAAVVSNASVAHRVIVPIQGIQGNLNATVWNPTAANLNATVIGSPALVATGSIAASGVVFSQDAAQYQSASVHLTSIGAGNTIQFQSSNDNVNWFSCTMMPGGDLTGILTTTATGVGVYTTQLNSRYFRVNCSVYGSGTISATAYFKVFGNSPNSVGGYLSAQAFDSVGNGLTSQANGSQRALDVGIDVAGVQIDPRSIRALTAADVVTANAGTNLNTSALALDTSINGILLAQASTTAAQKGVLNLAAVATAAPSYTTGQTSPLSLTLAGGLRVTDSATPALGNTTMSASLPVTIASDQALSTGAVRSATGNLTAVNQAVTINPSGAQTIICQLSGTFTGTVIFETSDDNGTTWTSLFAWDQGNVAFASGGNVSGRIYTMPAYGNSVRTRCSAYTSGTIVATMIAGLGPMPAAYVSPVTFFPVQGSAAIGGTGTGVQPIQVGGLFQTTPATLTNGQQGALQQDSAQNLLVKINTALPAGAAIIGALSANQSTNVAQINGITPLMGNGVTGTGSLRVTLASDTTSNTNPLLVTQKGFLTANAPVQNLYGTTSITTAAYVQLIASTTSAATYIDIFDSSGQAMILAIGGAGSEVIQAYVPPGGDSFAFSIPAATRVAYKALSANATSGYLLMNLRA